MTLNELMDEVGLLLDMYEESSQKSIAICFRLRDKGAWSDDVVYVWNGEKMEPYDDMRPETESYI